MSCAGHLQEAIFRRYWLEQLEREKQRLETKRDCYRLAAEIYAYLDAHPDSVLASKRMDYKKLKPCLKNLSSLSKENFQLIQSELP